jgi:hypothetical protein
MPEMPKMLAEHKIAIARISLIAILILVYLTIRINNADLGNADLLHNIWTYESRYIFGGNYNYFHGVNGKDFFHEQQPLNTALYWIIRSALEVDAFAAYLLLFSLHLGLNLAASVIFFHNLEDACERVEYGLTAFGFAFALPFWDMHTCHLQLVLIWVPLLAYLLSSTIGRGWVLKTLLSFLLLGSVAAGPSYIGALAYMMYFLGLLKGRYFNVQAALSFCVIFIGPMLFFDLNRNYIKLAANGNIREHWQFGLYGVDLLQSILSSYNSQVLRNFIPKKINNGNLILVGLPVWFFILYQIKLASGIKNLDKKEFIIGLMLIFMSLGPEISIAGKSIIVNPISNFFYHWVPVLKSFRYAPFFFVFGYIMVTHALLRAYSNAFYLAHKNGGHRSSLALSTMLVISISLAISFPAISTPSRVDPRESISEIREKIGPIAAPVYIQPDSEEYNNIYMLALVEQKAKLINGSSGFFPLRNEIVRIVQDDYGMLCRILGKDLVIYNNLSGDIKKCDDNKGEKYLMADMKNKNLILIFSESERIDARRYYGQPSFKSDNITFEAERFTIDPSRLLAEGPTKISGSGFQRNNCKVKPSLNLAVEIVDDGEIVVYQNDGFEKSHSKGSIDFSCKYSRGISPVQIYSVAAK